MVLKKSLDSKSSLGSGSDVTKVTSGRPTSHLDVFLGEQPRSVRQDFVELAELLQLLRRLVQTLQPLWVAADLQEVVDVEVDQVGTLMSSCRLREQKRGRRRR